MADENKKEINELGECQKRAGEYLDNWKRERADFANYKKEEGQRMQGLVEFANAGVLLEAMDLTDDLEIAQRNAENKSSWEPILRKFQEWFKKHGIERISTEGLFDPHSHEAVEMEENGQKMQEVRAGYTMNGKVIRPARVKLVR